MGNVLSGFVQALNLRYCIHHRDSPLYLCPLVDSTVVVSIQIQLSSSLTILTPVKIVKLAQTCSQVLIKIRNSWRCFNDGKSIFKSKSKCVGEDPRKPSEFLMQTIFIVGQCQKIFLLESLHEFTLSLRSENHHLASLRLILSARGRFMICMTIIHLLLRN